jgi:SAM-dependent methyltransferase
MSELPTITPLGGQMERTVFDERREVPDPEGVASNFVATAVWRSDYAELWRELDVQAAASLDVLPIPPAEVREGYFGDRHLEYWLSGYADRIKMLQGTGLIGANDLNYLDFGGSSGRVARHFVRQKTAPWCCDINVRSVDWVAKYLSPSVLAFQNRPVPHLPFEDRTFDIVSAFSVFTHIDLDEMSWLLELRRIVKPDGFVYVTVHDEHTLEAIKTTPWKRNRIGKEKHRRALELALQNGLPSERFVLRYDDRGIYDANVFVESAYLKRRWAPFFSELRHFPVAHEGMQSGVVLRK